LYRIIALLGCLVIALVVGSRFALSEPSEPPTGTRQTNKETNDMPNETADIVVREELPETKAEWKKLLTPEEFYVLRQKGTERAFTGSLWKNKERGVYCCSGCGDPLFESETKFDSGTGWPSYYEPIEADAIETEKDRSLFLGTRTEVHCRRCGGHLGHVFDDGPPPTGLRYCINSVSLQFAPHEESAATDSEPGQAVSGSDKPDKN